MDPVGSGPIDCDCDEESWEVQAEAAWAFRWLHPLHD